MKRKQERIDGGKSFGEDIKGVEDPRKIPEQRQNQTYPKLNLQQNTKIPINFYFCELCEKKTNYKNKINEKNR